MAFRLLKLTLAFSLAGIVAGQQLFANEPPCAESCYQKAVSINGCGQQDLTCQCAPTNQAAIALAGGPCLLASCAVLELSSFSSAWTAACSTATAAPSVNAAAVSTSVSHVSDGTGPLETSPSQDGTLQIMGSPRMLNGATITGIVVGITLIGLMIGLSLYCLSTIRRRKLDKSQWEQLEKEKTAIQASLEELKRAVSRQESWGSNSDMEEIKTNRPKTVIVNWKDGPQELMVPEKVFHELPASPARWEKM